MVRPEHGPPAQYLEPDVVQEVADVYAMLSNLR